MACIWYGVQAYIGGECVYLMIRSIWKSWVSTHDFVSITTAVDLTDASRIVIPFQTHSLLTLARQPRTGSASSSSG